MTSENLLSQWVESVTKFSSEYNGWPANNVIGKSNTYPHYGDLRTAWAPSSTNGGMEFLELKYKTKVYVSEIEIYETYNPGKVCEISILDPNGKWDVIFRSDPVDCPSVARIFSPDLKQRDYKSGNVRIVLDTSNNSSYSEIDAVKLIGFQSYWEDRRKPIIVKNEYEFEQWVHQVVKYSSEYNGWPAKNVIGKSNTYPNYGDIRTAWAPLRSSGQFEFLELKFETEVYPKALEIYETYNPGAIFKISCKDQNDNWDVIWEGKTCQAEVEGVSRIFKPELKEIHYLITEIRIDMNTRGSKSWSEIDAVKLIGHLYDFRKVFVFKRCLIPCRGIDTHFRFS